MVEQQRHRDRMPHTPLRLHGLQLEITRSVLTKFAFPKQNLPQEGAMIFISTGQPNTIEEEREIERAKKLLTKFQPDNQLQTIVPTAEDQTIIAKALFTHLVGATAKEVANPTNQDDSADLTIARKLLKQTHEYLGRKLNDDREYLILGIVDDLSTSRLATLAIDQTQPEINSYAEYFLKKRVKE